MDPTETMFGTADKELNILRVLMVLVLMMSVAYTECPPECSCTLDIRGRRQVTCTQGGMINSIPTLVMDTQVEVLHISAPDENQNYLTIGPIFQHLSHLEELRIVNSNVPAIGKHSFWGVPTLKTIDLARNNISQVLESNFMGLANLFELYLDDNRIESMHSGTFRHLQELRVLSLTKNRITELAPRLFLKLAKLQKLDLSGNSLEELNPEVFKDVQELRVFSCRDCALRNINTHIYSLLSSLTHLDLGNNQFKYIASDEFKDLKKLQVLRLDGNQIPVVLERTFSAQKKLQTLCLARNRLAKVTDAAFANLTTLKELDLSYNKLDRIETVVFVPLSDSLRSLNISGNGIAATDLKYTLQVITKLKELSLADMQLVDLPLGLLVYVEHLRFLNLSGNQMTHFPAQVLAPVPRLTELDLSRNQLHGLDERGAVRLEMLPLLHLHGNPWSCDMCHIIPMLTRVNRSLAMRNIVCRLPYGVQGRTLGALGEGELAWCGGLGYGREDGFAGLSLAHRSQIGLIAAGAAVALLLITGAALVATVVYSKHHTAYYYTHEEKRGPEHDAIFENHVAIGETGKCKPTSVTASTTITTTVKKVSIATIDEITKDPDLQVLANGT
ncbi:insulin-like growth factor-binding protein complex acid labile subunit isoform X2 [Nilaparvata lugens]|uniref:insulin-like growth factor-binding protein complex acid labile subunit isoform X1 n=2 Tax=Nilaparvata lugens TaxID=108931 RepID=UPI00193D8E5A|nr:insulin-like growth factor-binding protein complex acid labile subunit isoform X1 [Nilaparvata lugens]XP_039279322.1 insulin-like growth factor-binding protein complex acid labile subunit isoform X2 [Nilaparvata lugens]